MILKTENRIAENCTCFLHRVYAGREGVSIETVQLSRIENEHKITPETDREFLYEYQKAVLLALVESGRLTEQQYRYAEEKLQQQWHGFENQHDAHSSNGV